jgi:hypothetical protein
LSGLARYDGNSNATAEDREIARLALVISPRLALVEICSVVVQPA